MYHASKGKFKVSAVQLTSICCLFVFLILGIAQFLYWKLLKIYHALQGRNVPPLLISHTHLHPSSQDQTHSQEHCFLKSSLFMRFFGEGKTYCLFKHPDSASLPKGSLVSKPSPHLYRRTNPAETSPSFPCTESRKSHLPVQYDIDFNINKLINKMVHDVVLAHVCTLTAIYVPNCTSLTNLDGRHVHRNLITGYHSVKGWFVGIKTMQEQICCMDCSIDWCSMKSRWPPFKTGVDDKNTQRGVTS